MKTFIRISAIACGLFLAGSTFAQDKTAPAATTQTPGTATRMPNDPSWVRMDLARLNNVTKPTKEQMGKLKDIEGKYEKERHALPANLTPEERMNQLKMLMVKRDAEIKSVLTPEQNKLWDEARANKTAGAKPAIAPAQPAPAKK